MVSLYPKKDNFLLMLHFTCTCIKFFTKSIQIVQKNIADSSIETMFFDGSFF